MKKIKTNLTKKELNSYCTFSLEIAKKAGEILLKYIPKIETLRVRSKKAQGVVSTADLASEKFIIDQIIVNILFQLRMN